MSAPGLNAEGLRVEIPLALSMDGAATMGVVLRAVLDALEADPALVERMRRLLVSGYNAATPSPYMSVAEYAAHARLSQRTVRTLLGSMTAGDHFHRDGAKGRRIVIHTEAADRWRETRRFCSAPSDSHLVADEVTRRRAETALRKSRAR